MDVPLTQLPPGDPKLVKAIVQDLKSGGKFDQFRKECLADVDTKPAYQNLQLRVESQVKKFLSQTFWKSDLNKNQLRDGVRKHVQESGMLDTGIDSIINQVVNPKIQTVILPCVEESVYAFLNIDPSQARVVSPSGFQGGPDSSTVPRPLLPSDVPHAPGPHDGSAAYSHMPPQHMPVHPSTSAPFPPHVPQHLPPQMAPQHYPSQFAPPPPVPQHQPPPPPHYPPMYHAGGMVPSDDTAVRHYQPPMHMGAMGPLPPMGPGIGPPGSHPPLPPQSVPHQPPPPLSLPPQIGPPPPSVGSGGGGLCPPYMGPDIDSPILGPPGIDDIERRQDYRPDLNDPRLPPPMPSSTGESDERHEYSAAKFEDTRLPPPSTSGRDTSDLEHLDREDHHRSGKYDDPRLSSAGIDSPDLAKDRDADYGRSAKYDSPRMEADHHHKDRHEHRKKYDDHRRRSPSPDDPRKADSRHSASSSHRTKYEDSRKYESRSYERKYDDRRYDSDEPMDFDHTDPRTSESRGSKSRHRREPRDFGDEYSGHSSSQRSAPSSKERSRHHHHKAETEERGRYRHLGGDLEERTHHHPPPDMEERGRHHPPPDMEERVRHRPPPDMEERSRHHPLPDMEERSRHRGVSDFEERSRPRPVSDLEDSTQSLGQKQSPLPPMETDVISSEEDDILGAKSASVSPATSKKSIPVGDSEEARDGFPRPRSAASDIGTAAGEVQRLSLRDEDHHAATATSSQPAPHLPLFDAQSLDSISSNSSVFSFSGGGVAAGGLISSKTSSQASLHSLDGDLRTQEQQGSHGAGTPPLDDGPPLHGRRSPVDIHEGRDPQSPDPVARATTPDGAMAQDTLLSGASPISADGSVDSADSTLRRRPDSVALREESNSPLEPCAPGTEERISPLLLPPLEPSGSVAVHEEPAADPRPGAERLSPVVFESGSISARAPSLVDHNPDESNKKKDDSTEKPELVDDHYSEKSVGILKKDDEDGANGGSGGSSSQGTTSSSNTSSGTASTSTGESQQQQQKTDTPSGNNDSQSKDQSAQLAKLREELKARNLHVVARPHHMPYHKILRTPITVPKEKIRVNGQLNSSSSKQSSVKKEIKSTYAPTAFENALLGLEYKKKLSLTNKAKPEQMLKSEPLLAKPSAKELPTIVANGKVDVKSTSKSLKDVFNKSESSKPSSSKDHKKMSNKDDLLSKQRDKNSSSKRDSYKSSRDGLKENRSDKSSLSKSSEDRRKSSLDNKPSSKHNSTKNVVDSKSKTEDRRKHDDHKSRSSHDKDRNSKFQSMKVDCIRPRDDRNKTKSSSLSKKSDPRPSSHNDNSSNSILGSRDSRSTSVEDPGKESKRYDRKSITDSALLKNEKGSSKSSTKDGLVPSSKEGNDRTISSKLVEANDKRGLSTKKETRIKRSLDSSDSEDNVSTAKKPKLLQNELRNNSKGATLKTPVSNQSGGPKIFKKKYSSSRGSESDSCSGSSSESSSNGSSSSKLQGRSITAKLLNLSDDSSDEDFTPNLSIKKNHPRNTKLNSRKRTRHLSFNSLSSDSDDKNERKDRKKKCLVKETGRRNRTNNTKLISRSSDSDNDRSKSMASSSNCNTKLNSCRNKTIQLSSPPDSAVTSQNTSHSNIKTDIEPKMPTATSLKDVDEDVLSMADNIAKRLSSASRRAALKPKIQLPVSDLDLTDDDHDRALSGERKVTKKMLCSASLNSSQESGRSMAPLVLENSDTDSSDSAYEMLRQEVKINRKPTTENKFNCRRKDKESKLLSSEVNRKSFTSPNKLSLNNTGNSNGNTIKVLPKKRKRNSGGDHAGSEHIEVTKDGVMIMTDSGKKILLSYDDSQADPSTSSGLFNSDDEASPFEGFAGLNFSSDDGGKEFEGFISQVMQPSVVVLEDIFDFAGFPDCSGSSISDPKNYCDASKKYISLLNILEKIKNTTPVTSPMKCKRKDLSLTVTGDMFNKDLPIKVFLDSMVKLGAQVTGFHAFLVKSPKRRFRKVNTPISALDETQSSCGESPVIIKPAAVPINELPVPLEPRAERVASRGAKRVTPDTSDSELLLPQPLLQKRRGNDVCSPFTASTTRLRCMGPLHSDLVLLTPEDDQLQSEGSCSSPKDLEVSPYVPLSPSSDVSADGGAMDHNDKRRVAGKLSTVHLS